jgi:hypothetical protein
MIASISKSKGINYLKKDYYDGIERRGVWLGSGAAVLGLAGEIRDKDWDNAWNGYGPDEKRLVMMQEPQATTLP